MTAWMGTTDRPPEDRSLMGAVYTPDELANWVAALAREAAPSPIRKILDPACGDGALLRAAQRQIPTIRSIAGFDVSQTALDSALAGTAGSQSQFLTANALEVEGADADAVIMNPPWGAEVGHDASALRGLGYSLATGQFDSWDLFIEWTTRALAPGTTVAAIIPDSVFLPEHTRTRRLLLDRTELRVVARLGEGWFDGVFRGVAVLVYTTGNPSVRPVQLIRIDREARRRVAAGMSTLEIEAGQATYEADPATWSADPGAVFPIGGVTFSSPWATVVQTQGGRWTDWFEVGRGVEMGASGELFRCDDCGWHRGPSRQALACPSCGQRENWSLVEAIVEDAPQGEEFVPLIVGRDVRRFFVQPSRWLRIGLRGVSYKDPSVYARPKLLVRKTGLGLNAAVDQSGSYTNQVVFHYLPREGSPDWALHYVEGLLCSKVLLAVHLASSGDTEWRSHPYVTPKVIETLPIPVPADRQAVRQAEAIACAVEELHELPRDKRAAREGLVDELVAGIFGLDEDGCRWVDAALEQTQDLEAFAHVRSSSRLRSVAV